MACLLVHGKDNTNTGILRLAQDDESLVPPGKADPLRRRWQVDVVAAHSSRETKAR